jgi:sialic acid synthase SpsE
VNKRTYIIVNCCHNHNGDSELAEEMLQTAIENGADALKIPLLSPSTCYTSEELEKPSRLKDGSSFGEWLERIQLSKETIASLKKLARGKIDILGAPKDEESLALFEEIGIDGYSIEPTSLTDEPLLKAIAKSKKRTYLSVGACTEEELKKALTLLKGVDFSLLHCIASKPLKAEDAHLSLIAHLKKYCQEVGFNDYENGIALAPVAVALGATIIEKRFTMDRSLEGFDQNSSLEPIGLRKMIRDVRKAEKARDEIQNGRPLFPSEMELFDQEVKTLAATRKIDKGEKLTAEMLTLKAPNKGLLPHMLPELLGKRSSRILSLMNTSPSPK